MKRIKEYEDSIVVTSKKISCGGVAVAIMEVAESSFKWLRWWVLNMFCIVFAHTKKSLKLKQPSWICSGKFADSFSLQNCKWRRLVTLCWTINQCKGAVLLDDAYFKGFL